MARIRYLKPDFFKDENIAKLPHQLRLFYAGLWCQADKMGRLEDRSERLKIEIFPYEKFNTEKALQQLAVPKSTGRPYILRYEVNNERYIQILTWQKHQKPHNTERDSEIPPPTKEQFNSYLTDKQPLDNRRNGEGNGEGNGEQPTLDFDQLWTKYPKRIGKKAAERHFRASVKTEKDWQDIQTALKNYLESERVAKGFIQNGSTWFNDWESWVNLKEPFCPKCKGRGVYTSSTGFEGYCECPAGVRAKANGVKLN